MNQQYTQPTTPPQCYKTRLRMWPVNSKLTNTTIHQAKSLLDETRSSLEPQMIDPQNKQKQLNSQNQVLKDCKASKRCTKLSVYSPSIKTQKKKYLKLFATNTVQKSKPQAEKVSKVGIVDFGSSFEDKKSTSPSKLSYESSESNKVNLRRKLFCDLTIEKEEKIIIDSLEEVNLKDLNTIIGNKQKNEAICLGSISILQNVSSNQYTICQGCLAFHNHHTISFHHSTCPAFLSFLALSPSNQRENIKQKGMELMEQLESERDWTGLGRSWSNFLKECDLVWNTGRSSCIYDFKLKQVQANSKRLANSIENLYRLNFLLHSIRPPQYSSQ